MRFQFLFVFLEFIIIIIPTSAKVEYYEKRTKSMEYFFNKNVDEHGFNEVHSEECIFFPSDANKKYIGKFDCCRDALQAAQAEHPDKIFDGCRSCCPECHKG